VLVVLRGLLLHVVSHCAHAGQEARQQLAALWMARWGQASGAL
jgi:hypothetical protein